MPAIVDLIVFLMNTYVYEQVVPTHITIIKQIYVTELLYSSFMYMLNNIRYNLNPKGSCMPAARVSNRHPTPPAPPSEPYELYTFQNMENFTEVRKIACIAGWVGLMF